MGTNTGVRANLIRNDKFKTSMIAIFFSTQITKENCAINALIPAILRRGTKTYPTMKAISKKLESLYGAKFDCGVSKKGERQIISFYGECVNSKYINNEEDTLAALTELIKNVIFNPMLQNGKFNPEYVEQEKKQVKDLIEARKNDKVQYAPERCYELMFNGEPLGLLEYGTAEDIDNVSPEELINTYKKMIDTYQVDIIVSGDVTNEQFENIVKQFELSERETKDIGKPKEKIPEQVKTFTEKFDINQGKLSLGYRMNIDTDSNEYYGALVYNGILGGGVQSKLFQNVREKNSLAYYAFSRYNKFMNTFCISSGIEIVNYDKALDTILEQVSDMKKGNITDYEFNTTIVTIENSLNSMKDEQFQMLDYSYGQILCNKNLTIEEIIEKIKHVTIDDVVKVANKAQLDTIYFMTSKEEN